MFPSGRFALIGAGELRQPGQCSVCGNGTCVEGYLDLDIYFEWEGNIYLCMNCVSEAINVVGGLLPKEANHLRETAEGVAVELKATKEQLNDFRELADLINRARPNVLSGINAAANTVVEEQPAEPVNTNQSTGGSGSGESEPKRPVKGRRPNDPARTKSSEQPTINL